MSALVGGEVYAVAAEIFAALVDGEEGGLAPASAGPPAAGPAAAAWVDVHGAWAGRVSVETSAETAADLARALLRRVPGAPVSDEELADAFGEVANVVGGNVKALLPRHGTLGLPRVAGELPAGGLVVERVPLSWRGRPLVVTVWAAGSQGDHNVRADGGARPDGWEVR